jgi:hypothetical protein
MVVDYVFAYKRNKLVQLLDSYNKRICSFVSVDESAGWAPLSYAVTGIGETIRCGT